MSVVLRRSAMFACLAAVAVLAAAPAGGGAVQSFRANQRVAAAFAQRELAAVMLRSGATAANGDPSAGDVLGAPLSRPGLAHLIDRHGFWRVPGTPGALLAWLGHHPPAGTRLTSSGAAGDRSGTYAWSRSFSYRTLPSAVYQAELDFGIAHARDGGTAVRVDSFAVGLVPRPAWETIPAGVRSVAITVIRDDRRRSYPVATLTDRAAVARLVARLDRFRIMQPGIAFGCTLITGATPELELRFRSAGATTLARMAEVPCGGMSFSLGGRRGPSLQPDVDLTKLLWSEHILPVCSRLSVRAGKLTRTPAPKEFFLPLEIRDTGLGACGLRGYPRIRALIATGGPALVPRVTRIPAGHPVTPPVVLLDPSWPAPTSISWPGGRECKALPFKRMRLRLPGVRSPFTVGLRQPISPCGARLWVAPI